jgi:hypothetical protein
MFPDEEIFFLFLSPLTAIQPINLLRSPRREIILRRRKIISSVESILEKFYAETADKTRLSDSFSKFPFTNIHVLNLQTISKIPVKATVFASRLILWCNTSRMLPF